MGILCNVGKWIGTPWIFHGFISICQGNVTFDDVAIYFSEEQWALLNDDQKGLYCDVMLDNFALVASLGKTRE